MLVGLSFFTEFVVEDSPRSPESDDRPSITRRVALTFDDLPGVALAAGQKCDAQELLQVSAAILEPFRREDWPVTAFVTEGRLCEELGRDDLARCNTFLLLKSNKNFYKYYLYYKEKELTASQLFLFFFMV